MQGLFYGVEMGWFEDWTVLLIISAGLCNAVRFGDPPSAYGDEGFGFATVKYRFESNRFHVNPGRPAMFS